MSRDMAEQCGVTAHLLMVAAYKEAHSGAQAVGSAWWLAPALLAPHCSLGGGAKGLARAPPG
ncbi:MAG: hypothetical protein M3Q08_08060 [Pseudomonadota bacterium]|nr:hypothetical protein [Pseudomonadota bacterium]